MSCGSCDQSSLLRPLRAHLDKLLEYCQNGVDEGATLVYGGKRVDRTGERGSVRYCSLESQGYQYV